MNTKATGVYVGKLVHQKKAIAEDAGVDDDLDLEAPKVIQFTHATTSHEPMLNVVLTPEQAPISHSVFNFVEPEAQPPAEDAPPAEDGEVKEAAPVEVVEEDILETYKHVYVSEVVREPKMWFKTVPRLGAFMSVPLIYDSCLSDAALDAAIENHQSVTAQNEKHRKELEAHEQEQ